jgi:hypothetical protein
MKKLNIILAGAALCFLGACAFKNEDGAAQPASASVSELKIDPNSDSDGDGVKDGEEVAKGRNPFVAELPELKVRFLQSYKIEVTYHKTGSDKQEIYVIDTKVKDTDPDYKFRVGSVFARSHALQTAASFGRFSSHNSGKIEERDYSWVSYPQLDSKFFNLKAFEFRSLLDSGIEFDNIKITLTNQARLMESPFFKEIKDLKLNFYYLNHETENYDLLSATAVDRHFQSGVYETFDVVIDHAPLNLLKDSFFKRGEFIISEVDDFEIPDLGTTSKTLLGSIKAKSLPVLVETPLEEKLYYVAVQSTGVRLQNILKVIYDRNYKVENDQLTEIGQFKNNLGDYTHLKEVQDKDKVGKWFVMTNEFKEHYLDHPFTAQDRIVLAFITGTDLAEQKQEQFYSFNSSISSQNSETIMPLGNITPNSKVDIQLKPLNRSGTAVENQKIHWVTGGPCGKNCIPRDLVCDWDINKFRTYDEPYFFPTDLSFEGEKLSLIMNGDEFSLQTLLKDKKVILYKVDSNVHLVINDISKIKELKDFEESQLSLKVKTFTENTFYGVKLVGMSGEWRGFGGCGFNTPQVAESLATHISKDTLELGDITGWATGATQRGWTYPLRYMDSGPYYQDISLGVSSVIQNYYN